MVTKRVRWPDPKTGVIIDQSVPLGPGGSGGSSARSVANTIGHMIAPNVGGWTRWNEQTGGGIKPLTIVVRPPKGK